MKQQVSSKDVVLDELHHEIHHEYKHHVGNLFYTNLLQGCTKLVNEESSVHRVSKRIVNIITQERQGRFVTLNNNNNKNNLGRLTYSQACQAVARVLSASLPGKKRSRSSLTIRCKVEKQYTAVVTTKEVHPYALELLQAVVRRNTIEVLNQPLHPSQLEPNRLRNMRLQLRQRYLAATGMNLLDFTQKLLEVWGGTLQETTVAAEIVSPSQQEHIMNGNEVYVTQHNLEQQDKNLSYDDAPASIVSDDALNNESPSFDDLGEDDLMEGLDFLDDEYEEAAIVEDPTWEEAATVPKSTTATTQKSKTKPKRKTRNAKKWTHTTEVQETNVLVAGSWSLPERLQFLNALKEHGCGKWASIAKLIPTRNKSQVKSFGRYVSVKFKLLPNQGPSRALIKYLNES